jgi:hypothetical protein
VAVSPECFADQRMPGAGLPMQSIATRLTSFSMYNHASYVVKLLLHSNLQSGNLLGLQ